jgi:hypothetical protein
MSISDTEIKKVTLPRFKDKVMYVPASDSPTKSDTSYVISSSFKGIVRLSPNNHNTTYERPTYQLSLVDDKNIGTTYSDAILFDNDVETAIKSEADITKRMIIGSDSDGYLIGFRISQDNFEFDNLGVIGVAEGNHLSIISAAQTANEDVLVLNGQRMPHIPNKIQDAANVPTYRAGDKTELIQPYEYHSKNVKITGSGDKSFLLTSQVTGDGDKFYKYQRTNYLIRELILEALMDFQTIPTGSIHWFPVTVEQFKNLVKENGGRPNVSFHQNEQVDPLLRDFLLCDGRRYNNKDFPELAKILWKEPIRRWREVNRDGTKYMLPLWDTECNKYGAKDSKKNPDGSTQTDGNGNPVYELDFTFRVPDLRHQFISSTYIDGITSIASGSASNGIKGGKNMVGAWCPDKTPPSSIEFRNDRHAHFISYGSYGKKYHTSNISISDSNKLWTDCSITQDILFNRDLSELHQPLDSPHVFILHNHPYAKQIPGHGIDNFRGYGWRYNTCSDRIHSGIDSVPATMWCSRPNVSVTEIKLNPETNTPQGTKTNAFFEWRQDGIIYGRSSPDVTAAVHPSSYMEIDEEFKGNTKWGETYEPWGNYQPDLYGHESTPKYYTMLPFIKI